MKPTDLTRRVALYQSRWDTFILSEVGKDPDNFCLDGYVRVSEVLEVTCTPLTQQEITAGQLRSLYALRAATADKFGRELADVDGRIESLRALPAPESKP